jgi:hypothetical protein
MFARQGTIFAFVGVLPYIPRQGDEILCSLPAQHGQLVIKVQNAHWKMTSVTENTGHVEVWADSSLEIVTLQALLVSIGWRVES